MNRFVRTWMIVAGLALGCAALAGCKEDPMMTARAMHATERADEAEAALKQVLATNPTDFEARRLMADVHRFRGDFARTETELQALWDEKGFADAEKEFPPQERAHRDLLENQFNELYAKWAESLAEGKDPAALRRVLESGLKWKPKSPTLNRQLVELHLARADALVKEGKKLEAAAAYEDVLQFRAMPQQRKDAQANAARLREEAFTEQATKRFEEGVKPELVAAKQWDQATGTIRMRVEVEVDRKLRQKRDADLERAREQAAAPTRAAIAAIVARITGLDEGAAAQTPVRIDSGDEKLGRGEYAISVAMKLEDIIKSGFAVHEKVRQAALDAQKKEGSAPADAADAAGEPDEKTGKETGTNNAPPAE